MLLQYDIKTELFISHNNYRNEKNNMCVELKFQVFNLVFNSKAYGVISPDLLRPISGNFVRNISTDVMCM